MSEYLRRKARESTGGAKRLSTSELKKKAASTEYIGESYEQTIARRNREGAALNEQLNREYRQRKQAQLTPAERYAQERISPNRKLNAMERRLDPGTSVQTANSAKREFERDTDSVIKARDKVNSQPYTATVGGDNLFAGLFSSNTRRNTADYANLAEEYRKKYNIKSDEEFNNALKYREYENARNKAAQEEAVKKAAYNKYDNLPDEGKELVKQAYGNTEYDKSSSAQIEDRISGNIVSKLDARDAAKEKLKKQYNLTDDDLKDIKKGYKDSKKYGTPITQDEDLTAKYDSLDMNAKDLLDKAYISVVGGQTANGMQRKYADDAISELQSNYGLSQNEISQLAIYRKRHKDETVGNKEFAEEQGKRAAQDATSIASIASIGTNVIGAVASPIAKFQDYAENKALERAGYSGDLTINTENPYYMPARFTKAIRQQRGEDLDTYWNNKLDTDNHVASFVYQTVMSGADSLVAARIGSLFPSVNFGGTINGVKNTISLGAAAEGAAYSMGAGGLMLGMGAGTDTMLELADKGASAQTAVMGGLVSGTFEMLFEDLSISQLGTFKGIEAMNMAKGWSKQAVKQNVKIAAEKLLGSTVTNASEEGLTELATLIYDTLANGDMSQYAEYYNNAVASGMSPDEARREALKDMTLQVLEAAAGGALMGAGFGVGGNAKLLTQRNTTYINSPDGLQSVKRGGKFAKELGREIRDAGEVDYTLGEAAAAGGNAEAYRDSLLKKKGGSANLTDKQIGRIALESQFATEDSEKSKEAVAEYRKSNREAVINAALEKLGDVKDEGIKKALYENYEGGNAEAYVRNFKAAAQLGSTGIDNGDTEAFADRLEMLGLDDEMSTKAIIQAYNSGLNSTISEAGAHNFAAMHYIKDEKIRESLRTQIEWIDEFGKKFGEDGKGLSFVFVDSLGDKNAFYQKGRNQIVIAVDAEGNMLTRTAGHETFHWIENYDKENGTEFSSELKNFVTDFYKNTKGEEWLNKTLEKNYRNYAEDDRISEFVADNLFDALTSKRAVEELTQSNPTFAQKILDHIRSVIDFFKDKIERMRKSGNYEEIEVMQENLDTLNELNNRFFDALNEIKGRESKNTATQAADGKAINSENRNIVDVSDNSELSKLIGDTRGAEK
ncbi:MAG: hypothetical protein IJL77_04430, partial [Clostridia bacterium]|nr:hypothetical protein [Clostridia bacterium]